MSSSAPSLRSKLLLRVDELQRRRGLRGKLHRAAALRAVGGAARVWRAGLRRLWEWMETGMKMMWII